MSQPHDSDKDTNILPGDWDALPPRPARTEDGIPRSIKFAAHLIVYCIFVLVLVVILTAIGAVVRYLF